MAEVNESARAAELGLEKPDHVKLAAFVLGVAMSGFFDGILLHQVLQWHHLLSLVPGRALQDPRVQVLADGMFHVLMYLLAMSGLVLIWRARRRPANGAGSKIVACAFVAGFGAWNVADVVVFHWILHIHNIRLDVRNPVAWDVAWLVLFGALPLLVAAIASRRSGGPPSGRAYLPVFLATITLMAGAWSLAPAPGAMTAVLFRPGLSDAQKLAAITSSNARLVAMDASGDLMVISLADSRARWGLFRRGALVVGGAMGGCLTAPSSPSRAL